MVRNTVMAAALAAGGLFALAPAPASAGVVIGVDAGPAYAGSYEPVYHRRWHRPGRYYGYRPYRPWRYRPYRRPAFGVYVAPAPRYYRRCWIDRWGYRVCR